MDESVTYAGFWVRVGIDKRKQGWHDKPAGTVVIRNKPTPVVFTRPESD